MAEIAIYCSTVRCHCSGTNRLVGQTCRTCDGRALVHNITYALAQPLPHVSMGRWARFKRRVGLEHPIEMQEWLRDMEAGFDERQAEFDAIIQAAEAVADAVILIGKPAKGKTYGVKLP